MTDKEIMEEVNAINNSESDPAIRKLKLKLLYVSQRRVLVPSEMLECINIETNISQAIDLHKIADCLDVLAQPVRDKQAADRAFDEGLGQLMERNRRRES